ncbi:MAG: DUF5615 family PIN-like protein, partial [Gemmatimonadaceae bacterium]
MSARLLNRILLSADTDFGMLLARRREAKPSVILFRGQSLGGPETQVELRLANLASIQEALMRGCI